MARRNQLEVTLARLVDNQWAAVFEPDIRVEARVGGAWLGLNQGADAPLYVLDGNKPATHVRVTRPDAVPIVRSVPALAAPRRLTIFLVGPEQLSLMRGDQLIPIARDIEKVGILLDPRMTDEEVNQLLGWLEPFGPSERADGEKVDRAFPPRDFKLIRPPTPELLGDLRTRLPELAGRPVVVGPVIYEDPSGFQVLRDELLMVFRPTDGVRLKRRLPELAHQYAFLGAPQPLEGLRPVVHWRTDPRQGTRLAALALRLAQEEADVLSVEVAVAGSGIAHSPPGDPGWRFQAAHQRMGLEAVWDRGLTGGGLTLAVLDATSQFGNVADHPELVGRFSGFLSPDDTTTVWSTSLGPHGTACMGLALAAHNDTAIAGVAPAALGVAAGLAPGSVASGLSLWGAAFLRTTGHYGPITTPPADVASCSHGFDKLPSAAGIELAPLETVVFEGRGGRGCPVFLSAGNDKGDLHLLYGARGSDLSLTCGASALIDGGETWADDTNRGNVTFCAPGGDDPGQLLSVGGVESMGPFDLTTASTASLLVWLGVAAPKGGLLRLTRTTTGEFEDVRVVTSNRSSDTVTTRIQGSTWTDFTNVTATVLPHTGGIGETSAATPLCAAIGLLVLQADPLLSWVELRTVLRETAERATLFHRDSGAALWPSNHVADMGSGDNRLGAGSLRADRAVQMAIQLRGGADGPRQWPSLCVQQVQLQRVKKKPVKRLLRRDDPLRRGLNHQVLVVIQNDGPGPGLDAWVRVMLSAERIPARNWSDGSVVLVGEPVPFTHLPAGERVTLPVDLPATVIPNWETYYLVVELFPHHGNRHTSGGPLVGAPADPFGAAGRGGTRYRSGQRRIQPA
jgi:hypothetical protein